MQAVRDFLQDIKESLGLDVYSFSVFHVFFEQYLSIGRDAAVLLVAALVAVTLITLLFTASLWASAMILLVLCMILVRLLLHCVSYAQAARHLHSTGTRLTIMQSTTLVRPHS
jgi:hypothetical protein